MSLDTLANVKTRLGISTSADDTLIGLLQDSADAFIENYCNRDFVGGTYTEYHAGGSEFVMLRNYPVASVTSVKVDPAYAFGAETLVAASLYVVHTDRGVIQSLCGPFAPRAGSGLVNSEVRMWTRGPRVVQVIYATATSSVPADVKEAYARLIAAWYKQVKTEIAASFQDLGQQKLGDTLSTFGSAGGQVAADVLQLLMPYREPVF